MTAPAGLKINADRLWLVVIIVAALLLAAIHYAHFLQNPRPRWNGLAHDRSGHYEFAQTMAIAVRQADPLTFFSTLEKAKVWPPVHGLCAAAVLAIGGIDYRLGVLPSLAGWVAMVVFGFLLARRLSPSSGNIAGLIAATMLMASPAHRIYAVDIMLESLGAALTVMSLYFYSVAKQESSQRAWRNLAFVLTILFFEKYNYWLLVVLALVAAELAGWRTMEWKRALAFFTAGNWRRRLLYEMTRPLTWIFFALAATAGVIFVWRPGALPIGGKLVSLYPPNNFVTLAYVALFLRVWQSHPIRHLHHTASRQLALWHVAPLAVSFLFPRRLSAFAWFLGPLNTGERSAAPLSEAVAFYLRSIAFDYHAAPWSALAAAALFLLTLFVWRHLNGGGLAVLCLVLISAAVTIAHPNQKSRFVHTWLPAFWIAGAAGVASSALGAGRLRQPLSIAAGSAVVLSHAFFLPTDGHAPETGCRGETSSVLDITDAYLSELAAGQRVAIFSNIPAAELMTWTYRERYQQSPKLEIPLKALPQSPEDLSARLEKWAGESRTDAVVLIDIAPESPDFLPIGNLFAPEQIAAAIYATSRFTLVRQWHLADHACTVSLWHRN